MQNFIFTVFSAYFLVIVPLVFNKILDPNDSVVDNIYFKHLFENSFQTNVRKIRSNSDQPLEWKSSEQSFLEVPVLPLKGQNETSIWSGIQGEGGSGDQSFAPIASIDILRENAEKLFSKTRNSVQNNSKKVFIQRKIFEEFQRNQLISLNQVFVTTPRESNISLEGINIIGIYPGIHWYSDSSKDRILVIGAHYDTVDKTDGVNDNGSGMTALLEIIRLIHSNNCRLTYSIIFVAFDLEELGALGSKYFVNDFIISKHLIERKSHFEGAIILDTILNFNQTSGSQDIPYDVHRALPEWSKQIRKNGFVGDFLALISRQNVDDILSNQIRDSWHSISGGTPYKLSQMAANTLNSSIPDIKTLSNHANMLRSDHIMFWYHNNTHYRQSLKAVLVTDTGPFRGYMRDCYHNSCDNTKHLNHKNLGFLKITAEVLAKTAVSICDAICDQ